MQTAKRFFILPLCLLTIVLYSNVNAQWIQTNGPYGGEIISFAVLGSDLFTGTYGGGVFVSTNNGTSWTAVNSGLTKTSIKALAVSGTDLFTGTQQYLVWRRPLSEMETSAESQSELFPSKFRLKQNYPNPFNPNTTINFDIPRQIHVLLRIYDLLGQEVVTLVDENLTTGSHQAIFNAENMPSGIYLYRLQAGEYKEERKLLLLR